MKAIASAVSICVMGVFSYLFCLLFPPFREAAPVIALLSTFDLGAIGAFLWQESEAWFISPLEWAVGCMAISFLSLVIFFANCWYIGLSPREAIFFPKHLWENIRFGADAFKWRGARYSLCLGIGSLIFGIGSLVREWILFLNPHLMNRSTQASRKRAAG